MPEAVPKAIRAFSKRASTIISNDILYIPTKRNNLLLELKKLSLYDNLQNGTVTAVSFCLHDKLYHEVVITISFKSKYR